MQDGHGSTLGTTMTLGEVLRRAEARRDLAAIEGDGTTGELVDLNVVLDGRAELERARLVADRIGAPSPTGQVATTAVALATLVDRTIRLQSALDEIEVDEEGQAILDQLKAEAIVLQERVLSVVSAAV